MPWHDAIATALLTGIDPLLVALEADGRVVWCNEAAEAVLGRALEGSLLQDVAEDGEAVREALQTVAEGASWRGDLRFRHDALPMSVRMRWHLFPLKDGSGLAGGVARDLTHERPPADFRAEIARSERLEAIGRLAGGVAHDFNNLLAIVIGQAEIAQRKPEYAPRVLPAILDAARRAGALTRELLLVGGRDPDQQGHPIDLGAILRSYSGPLHAAVGPGITLVTSYAAEPLPVGISVARAEQIVLNLVANARDAVGNGPGHVRIGTRRVRIDAPTAAELGVEPGAYAELDVRDDGPGIPPDIQRLIFDPFFTTKGPKGSGLGLATVHAIVTAAGGRVAVDSEVGHGARLVVQLPLSERPVEAAAAPEPGLSRPRRGGRVLVVDDDPGVAATVALVLDEAGYQTIQAHSAQEALSHLEGEPFALVLSDVVMPDTSGPELVARWQARHPGTPALLMTGHDDQRIPEDREVTILRKPFGIDDLVRAVDRAVEGGA